jgi:hypothetical protein
MGNRHIQWLSIPILIKPDPKPFGLNTTHINYFIIHVPPGIYKQLKDKIIARHGDLTVILATWEMEEDSSLRKARTKKFEKPYLNQYGCNVACLPSQLCGEAQKRRITMQAA